MSARQTAALPHPFRVTGQTAVITGGATGIGYGIARCFVQAGAQVVLVGRREVELRRAVRELGPHAIWESCDITQSAALPGLVERINARTGAVQILVNNAGAHLKKPALDTTESEMSAILQTCLIGAFGLTRLL